MKHFETEAPCAPDPLGLVLPGHGHDSYGDCITSINTPDQEDK